MTTALDAPVRAGAWTIGPPRLLAGLDRHDVLDARTHLAVHGALPGTDAARLVALLESVGLAGRGGAGFPLAAKLRAMRAGRAHVVVNGSESEPASRKDRTLLQRSPHLVLDGALAVASALDAHEVTVAVHDADAAAAVRHAIAERPNARRIRVETTSGRFVAGEARALARSLRGGSALPPGRREHLTDRGILVANVETYAQTAVLLRLGARGFADTGTRTEPGTLLMSVGGAAARPGVLELPFGTPLGIALRAAGADNVDALVIGGYHGTWARLHADVPISRAGLAAAGAELGAGVLLAVDRATCALGELTRVVDWLAAQSARQCGPCRFGLPALAADVRALTLGIPGGLDNAVRHTRVVTGRGACAHPDGTARFVRSALHALPDELTAHRAGGCGRPVLGRLPVDAT